jgi:hypothetical protein
MKNICLAVSTQLSTNFNYDSGRYDRSDDLCAVAEPVQLIEGKPRLIPLEIVDHQGEHLNWGHFICLGRLGVIQR